MRRSVERKYVGLTYSDFLDWGIWRRLVKRLWKRFCCPKNVHMFDEVFSGEHYLACDACGLKVHIALIETSEEACNRADQLLYIETTVVEKSHRDPAHCVQL